MSRPDERVDDVLSPLESEAVWPRLIESLATYRRHVSPAYDEVLDEVTGRIAVGGSIGKADIGALLMWKRLRADTQWARELSDMRDADVRTVTAPAVAVVRDIDVPVVDAARAGRRLLSPLPGFRFGDALASAILVAAAPHRMAVYDRHAHSGLTSLGYDLSSEPGRYGRYMGIVEELREIGLEQGSEWTARDVDLALYQLGRSEPR
ncbi:hypothetical protein ACFYOT_42460 [Saccharothrix saharensis]|uniref:hypothetical protein n=1 Tax=Saccharothrix saharensis TaxID=571190 RepID=UPI0036A8E1C7